MSKQFKSQQDFGEPFPAEQKKRLQPPKFGPMQRTRERLKIIRKNLDKADAEIGRIFGISRAAVYELRVRYGIIKEKRANTQRKERLVGLIHNAQPGLTPEEMALKLGLSKRHALYYAQLAGYHFQGKREAMRRYWKEKFKSLPQGLTMGMLAERLEISYVYAITLCQKHRYKARRAGSSKPPSLPERR